MKNVLQFSFILALSGKFSRILHTILLQSSIGYIHCIPFHSCCASFVLRCRCVILHSTNAGMLMMITDAITSTKCTASPHHIPFLYYLCVAFIISIMTWMSQHAIVYMPCTTLHSLSLAFSYKSIAHRITMHRKCISHMYQININVVKVRIVYTSPSFKLSY